MDTIKGTYTYEYPRPAVTTDCIIFGYDVKEGLSVLLVERGVEPFKGSWAFPGGFMKMDETAETCAVRELIEETGLDVTLPEWEITDEELDKGVYDESPLLTEAKTITCRTAAFMDQLGCFTDINRDPRGRVITIAYYAIVKKGEVRGGDDAHLAKWFPIADIPTLAFDHEMILRVALKKLKEKIHFKPIGFELLPEVFTMPQLQSLYESILEVHFDRRNFANKMLKLGVLEEAGDRPEGAARSVPGQYRFNPEKYAEMKAKGFRLEF